MSPLPASPQRTAARLARSAAVFGLGAVSARAGVTLHQLRQTLTGFIPRGSCGSAAAAAAVAASTDSELRRRVLLGHEACPPPIRRLNPDEYTAKEVAGWRSRHAADSDAPAVLMRRCAGHDSFRARQAAASNLVCPSAVMEALSDDPVSDVRKRLAAQPALRGDVLERFAVDVDEEVRCAAARHPALPLTVWAAWAADPDETRRGAAAANPSAPVEVLQQMAGDSDALVRQAVAINPACPLETLSNLRRDPHELVATSALTNRDLRTARDCTTPAERLAELTLHSNEDVLCAVASNPSCPDDALERLAGNKSSSVRREAARNHNCPQQRGVIYLSDHVAVSYGHGRVRSSCSSHLRAFAAARPKLLQRDFLGAATSDVRGGWTGSTACLVVGLRRQGQSSQDAERAGDSPEEASRTNMPDRQMLVTQVYTSPTEP